MGKAQVAKTGYFCWEGEEVTEWTQCFCEPWAAASAFTARGTDSTAGEDGCPRPAPWASQSITIWACDTSQEDTNPGAEKIMNTFHVTSRVQKHPVFTQKRVAH